VGPSLVLIAGLPGAGKSTLARALGHALPAVRLDGDAWLLGLGIDLHEEPPRDRIEILFWQLTQQLLSLGVSVILESGFWLRADRDEKRLGARALDVRVELHHLDVPLDERWRRIGLRNQEQGWRSSPISYEQLASWDRFFEPPSEDELALFDPPDR